MAESKKKIPVIRIILSLFFVGVFIISGFKLLGYFSENKKSDDAVEKLIESAVTVNEPPTQSSDGSSDFPSAPADTAPETPKAEEKFEDYAPISVDFELLQAKNPDIVGWIYSKGTQLNYPIVKGTDNDYYLGHLIDGRPSVGGTLFMDFRNETKLSDLNTFFYGHNMRNDSMFGSLLEYRRQSYYNKHPYLWYITRDGNYRLEPIAGYVTSTDSDAYNFFISQESLDKYIEKAIKKSTFKTKASLEGIDRIITLSTCYSDKDDSRYVVICRMEKI